MPTSRARVIAATTAEKDIEPGTPEEAYQAVNFAKMLWGFRLRDTDAWRSVIEHWTSGDIPAWMLIPEDGEPYKSPRRMIETELKVDYGQFKEFIRIVLGHKYVALIDEPTGKRGGKNNPQGNNQYASNGQSYARTIDLPKKQSGNSQEHLRRLISEEHPEVLDEIGKGKKYKTVNEAARKLGIRVEDRRYHISYDPIAAARYLAQRVDREWLLAMVDEYMKATEPA